MAPIVMPDVSKMVITLLRASPAVQLLVGNGNDSIRGNLQPTTQFPAVRVTRITDETMVAHPHVLESVRMQIDCWGGNNRQAERLAQTCKAVLLDSTNYVNDEGIVTKVRSAGLSDQVDDTFTPARERYILDLDITVQPLLS